MPLLIDAIALSYDEQGPEFKNAHTPGSSCQEIIFVGGAARCLGVTQPGSTDKCSI